MQGNLYLLPTTIGDTPPLHVLPFPIKQLIDDIEYYVVEEEKTARKFIKSICPQKNQQSLHIKILNEHTPPEEISNLLASCLEGFHTALMAEAGCPAIADPGAALVKLAHQKGIRVIPLVGPSSILLALMASGINGQSFAFNGYLPIDAKERKRMLRILEKRSQELHQSQIFIETPYRNDRIFSDSKETLQPDTLLCIACDITLPTEFIRTQSLKDWKKTTISLHKKPCIFIIYRE